ncbi:MAG: hypothetical protein Q9207_008596, partial [Kuettlingeria erythrocarpa]
MVLKPAAIWPTARPGLDWKEKEKKGNQSGRPWQFCQHERPDLHLNGEGSSRDFSSPGSSRCSAPSSSSSSALPISCRPERKTNPWSAERSHAEISLQRKNKDASSKWSWSSAAVTAVNASANKCLSGAEDQTALLKSSLFGPRRSASERRNSWAREARRDSSSSSSEEEEEEEEEEGEAEEEPDANAKGKGNRKPNGHEPEGEETELTPHVPRSFLTGINLSQPYHFSDGLAYPLLPLPARKSKSGSKSNQPQPPQHPSSRDDDIT